MSGRPNVRHGSGREDQQLADGHFCRQRVIAKNPTNVEARIYLARAFTKTGDPRQALRVLSFISGVDTAELRIERARALIALTDYEEAVKLLKPLTDGSDLQKLSAEDRRSAKSLAAVAYSMSKNYAAADKLYEELLAELDNPIIRYNYAPQPLSGRACRRLSCTASADH